MAATRRTFGVAALLVFTALSTQSLASDVEELTAMLHDFLAKSDKAEAHQRFWADDLVYTSSAGARFGKAEIMRSFETAGNDAEGDDAASKVIYSAKNVDVRLYGEMAIVAFELVGTPVDHVSGGDVLHYYNTGTFLKRDGVWQVVAWQATKIPAK